MRLLYSLSAAPPAQIYGGERLHLTLIEHLVTLDKDLEPYIFSYNIMQFSEIWRKIRVPGIQIKKSKNMEILKLPIHNWIPLVLNFPSAIVSKGMWFLVENKSQLFSRKLFRKVLRGMLILSEPYCTMSCGYVKRSMIKDLFKKINPNIVHTYGIHLFWLHYYLTNLAHKNNIPTVVWTLYHPYLIKHHLLFTRPRILRILSEVDAVVSLTRYEKMQILKQIGENDDIRDKMFVVPVPIDTSKFVKPSEEDIRKVLENLGNPDYVILSNTLQEEKGVFHTLYALSNMETEQKILFVTFGRASSREIQRFEAIKKRLPKNIDAKYLGYVDEVTKYILYQIADIFVMPSITDSFGIVYAEAWYYETPVIAAKNQLMEEIIGHKKRGLLVPYGNVEKLQSAISILLNDRELGRKLALNGKKYLMKELKAENVAKKVYDIYRKIV